MLNRIRAKKQPYEKDEVLNDGLRIAMSFNKRKAASVSDRLGNKYPDLSEAEREEYGQECQEAAKAGNDIAFFMMVKKGNYIDEGEFQQMLCEKFSWVSAKNLKKMFRRGMFYAKKEADKG